VASPKSRPRDGYPGRALSLILVIAVALVAIMFGTGYKTPHLGIDLAGGTSVTLTAHPPQGKPASAVNSTSMNQAVGILDKRVNGLGVSDASVQTQGGNTIVVTVPKGVSSNAAITEIGQTALLYFRPVLAEALSGAPVPTTSASPSASGSAAPSTKPQASSAAKPSATASTKTQGDALSQALTAGSTASSTAKPTDTAKPTTTAKAAAGTTPAPSTTAAPATSELSGTVPTALSATFNNLDCSKAEQRLNYQQSDSSDAIACSQSPQSGAWIKYALGPVAVAGADISSAQAVINNTNQWVVNLNFDSKGTTQFANITSTLAKATSPANQFAIVLDGQVQSAPLVQSAITGGQATIDGGTPPFTSQQANDLANVLSYGALPLTFKTDDITTVSPQLGSNQLQAGLVSGAIGLALVILYSLIYYRGLGLVAIAGLGLSAVLTYSIMSLLGGTIHFALNLPAVCGAIVAIGITADSFVVYFERIRDEVRKGSSLRPAVQRAWPRARRTILVSDFVSFLAAAVLYFFTVGTVQGFAFTLGLTTLLDVVVIFLFTKPLITLLARRKFFADGHPMSGLDPKRLGVRPPIRGGRRRLADPKEA